MKPEELIIGNKYQYTNEFLNNQQLCTFDSDIYKIKSDRTYLANIKMRYIRIQKFEDEGDFFVFEYNDIYGTAEWYSNEEDLKDIEEID